MGNGAGEIGGWRDGGNGVPPAPKFLPCSPSPRLRFSPALLLPLIIFCCGPLASAADRIVLRDFTVLRDDVEKVDADGIVLAEGRLVTWGEVESIEVDDDQQQAQADKLLKQIGEPLFRLRTRLETGDDEGLLEPAEALYPSFRERRSLAALIVLQSLVWGRIAHGQREAAVTPWLLEFETLRSRAARLSDLPGTRKPRLDAASALLVELPPVWFDAAAAKAALPDAEKALASITEPIPPGAKLYIASLALAAGDLAKAEGFLDEDIDSNNLASGLRQVLLAQRDVQQSKAAEAIDRLKQVIAGLEAEGEENDIRRLYLHPLALYWLGRAQLASEQADIQQAGLLTLLRIPALEGNVSPELAAAALHDVAQHYAKDTSLARRLQNEILQQFPSSWHARQLRATADGAKR